MKIFLFGSNGMLGNYMKSYLRQYYTVISINRNSIDASTAQHHDIKQLFLSLKYSSGDIVINCIGCIPQRKAYKSFMDCILINSVFPFRLYTICERLGLKFIHFTTDCVYMGQKGGYVEDDKTDIQILHGYGGSKYLGELFCEDACIIRTSFIGREVRNKCSLLEWAISNKNGTIRGYENVLWNGVTCLELAKIVHKIITKDMFWKGIRHVFSKDIASKLELLNMINRHFGLNMDIQIDRVDVDRDMTLDTIYTRELVPDKSLDLQIQDLIDFKLDPIT